MIYAAMAHCIGLLRLLPRALAGSGLVVATAAANWINPPYPFPYENNLALVDFVSLQQSAAQFVADRYPESRIETIWPLTLELSDPELGFVSRPIAVTLVPDLTDGSLKQIDWRGVEVFIAFSRTWDCSPNLMQLGAVHSLWQRHYGQLPTARQQIPAIIPLRLAAHFERRGQWVDIYSSVHGLSAPVTPLRYCTCRDSEKGLGKAAKEADGAPEAVHRNRELYDGRRAVHSFAVRP
jgi:hypothetical protein